MHDSKVSFCISVMSPFITSVINTQLQFQNARFIFQHKSDLHCIVHKWSLYFYKNHPNQLVGIGNNLHHQKYTRFTYLSRLREVGVISAFHTLNIGYIHIIGFWKNGKVIMNYERRP